MSQKITLIYYVKCASHKYIPFYNINLENSQKKHKKMQLDYIEKNGKKVNYF